MLKKSILFTVLITVSLKSSSQNVRDYYLPDNTVNKATFHDPRSSESGNVYSKTIEYLKNGLIYDIIYSNLVNNTPAAIQTFSVKFEKGQVEKISSITTNIMGKDIKHNYNPPKVIFKIPQLGKSITWIFNDDGDKDICTASWTSTNVGGIIKPTIKLITQPIELHARRIDYYVKGMGLYQSEIEGSQGKQITDTLYSLQRDILPGMLPEKNISNPLKLPNPRKVLSRKTYILKTQYSKQQIFDYYKKLGAVSQDNPTSLSMSSYEGSEDTCILIHFKKTGSVNYIEISLQCDFNN